MKDLFQAWLETYTPLKAERVMNRIRDVHSCKAYQAEFGRSMTGRGQYANLIQKRYQVAMKKLAFPGVLELNCKLFQTVSKRGVQNHFLVL